MTNSNEGAGPSAAALLEGRFEGRQAFRQAVRHALAAAAREGWREIVLCDVDFEDWPLGERATLEALGAWAARGRRLVLLAANFDPLVRQHPRFVGWRKTWDHIIEARRCAKGDADDLPSAIWTPHWFLHRLDPRHATGVASHDAERRAQLREQIDECLRRSSSAFPATTLGL
jgi:hypothetical protein